MSDAEKIVADFVALAESGLHDPDHPPLSDEQLARAMSAAVKFYSARAEATSCFPPPLDRSRVTATDVLVTICEMIRVADVNLFDLSMWFGRPRPSN